jgi:hypothetical protein
MSNDKVEVKKVTDEASLIWEEIRNVSIDLYALPNQKICDHVEVLPVPGTTLYLKPKSSAVLPSMESALSGRFIVTSNDTNTFLTVKREEPKVEVSEDFVIFQRPNGKVEKIPRNKF